MKKGKYSEKGFCFPINWLGSPKIRVALTTTTTYNVASILGVL